MKYAKKILSMLLLVTVIVAFMPMTNVSAATKINTTNKVIYVGSSYTLKVTGTKKTVKWSSNNKAVATVTSKGKVTAKSEGIATIKAKVGKKTYKCKVTAKYKFNHAETIKNISYTYSKIRQGVIVVFKNNNPFNIDFTAKMVFFDSKGNMLRASSEEIYCLERNGGESVQFFYGPEDDNYNYVDYDHIKIFLSAEKSRYISYASQISINSNLGSNNVTAEITNNSNKQLQFINISIAYYDASDNIIGYDYTYADCKAPKSVDYITFDLPHDDNYNTVIPSRYKIYVNHAYIW